MPKHDAIEGERPFPISPDGKSEAWLATLASAALAGLILYMRARGAEYWLAGIAVFYGISLRLALRIHALSYRAGVFRGEPLMGQAVEFRGAAIASIAHDNRSRLPRARLELKDGRRILIKRPAWMGPATAPEFEGLVKEKLAGKS